MLNAGVDPQNLCPNTWYSAAAIPAIYYEYQWYLDGDPIITYDYELDFETGNVGVGNELIVSRVNECGISDPFILDCETTDWFCQYYLFTVSPNPASNTLYITPVPVTNNAKSYKSDARISKYQNNISSNYGTIKEISIFNINGVFVKKEEFGGNTKQAQINITNLKAGTYLVNITDGIRSETHKIIIQK